jgi:PAS domain S-box-containing protein
MLLELMRNSDDIIVVKDLNLKVMATNMAFAKAAGYSSVDELIGKSDAEIFKVDESHEPIKTYMEDERRAQTLKKGEYISRVEPVTLEDGSLKYVYTKKYPIFKNDIVIATGNISVDITHQVETEKVQSEALAQQHKLAEIGKMINVITHQWKQPLNIIMLTASEIDELEDELVGLAGQGIMDSLLECRDEIEKQVGFLSQTITDFRDFLNESKNDEKFYASDIVSKVQRLLRPVFKKEDIVIFSEIVHDFELVGRENEFLHAVFNILNNAKDILKQRECEEKKVWIKVDTSSNNGVVEILDSAGGIDEGLLPDKLFDIYSSSHKVEGRGLGLYITKMLIEKSFCGSIDVENRDKGALFKIKIPLKGNNNVDRP